MLHKTSFTAVVLALSMLVAACGSDAASDTSSTLPSTTQPPTSTTTTTTIPRCIDVDSTDAPAGLPGPVAETYTAIIEALLNCDFEELGRLASDGERDFTYSFGGSEDPAGFWSGQTPDSETIQFLAAIMLKSFGATEDAFGTDEPIDLYFWPAVFGPDPTDEQWDEVRDLYSDEEIDQMKDFGGYIGLRSGIAEDGEWMFFVAGD